MDPQTTTNELYKVYLFYLKDEPGIYAFTIDKEIKKKFLAIRNKKCFTVRKAFLIDDEYNQFYRKNSTKILADYPLGKITEWDYHIVPMTAKENAILNEEIDKMEREMSSAIKEISPQIKKYKQKYKDACNYLAETSYLVERTLELVSRINTFRVFVKVFGNTLSEDYQDS